MARAYLKYLLSLLIFGTNGIVANHISLSSRQIVFMRTLIGGLFLGLVFFLSKGRLRALSDRRCLLFLLGSGVCMGTWPPSFTTAAPRWCCWPRRLSSTNA